MWYGVDPLADKHPDYTTYAYCYNNPVKLVDPIGLDTLVFDSNNRYLQTINADGMHVGKKLRKDGFIFNFADPVNDPKNIGNKPGQIKELYILDEETILKDLERAGVKKEENRGLIDGPIYLKNHSHAGTNSGELDFVINSEIFGSTTFGEEKIGNGLPGNYLYITNINNKMIGHNNYNFGNFLWGAAAKSLQVSLGDALIGAHINNYLNDVNNQGKKWYRRSFDSSDDQYSIKLGYWWRSNRKK